ncbi:MAG: hypothetical protein A3F67_01825 [Verrucomicrobia bacterium RIFCSPHIGHO2_12_FULL_41_10]|nr:MAG: hypothetical protein A3F67_01825 [Verrucomicrobia bacterium RIFCSPHIGHO2_12_FULL_41_10]HLB34393.1 SH3 domain-containing protein [Chthoniobacterales bacterium]
MKFSLKKSILILSFLLVALRGSAIAQSSFQRTVQFNSSTNAQAAHLIQSAPPQEVNSEQSRGSVALVSTNTEVKNLITTSATDSPERYYNEALVAKEKGDLPAASLALRRALILNPTFAPALNQLSEVLTTMGLPQEISWQTKLAAKVSPETLALVGTLVGWSAAFVVIWLFFTRNLSSQDSSIRKRRKRWPLFLAILVFLLGHAVAFLGTTIDPRTSAQEKVVLLPKSVLKDVSGNNQERPKETPLRATPVDNAAPIAQLSTGSCLTLLSRHGVWSYVRTHVGQEGWIPSATLQSLIPTT